jgi:pSer/pThr/pTyr-binding forkhead associated (FHA) protein
MSQFNKYLEIIQEQKYEQNEGMIGDFFNKAKDKFSSFLNKDKKNEEIDKKNEEIDKKNEKIKFSITNISGVNIIINGREISNNNGTTLELSKDKVIYVGGEEKGDKIKEKNNIIIPIGSVSRNHFKIEYVGKDELLNSDDFKQLINPSTQKKQAVGFNLWGLKITDLKSTNGTFINNRAIGRGGSKIIFQSLKGNKFIIGASNNVIEIEF